ncbi:Four and a half LIM domains protein 3 [Liparis tanakae]|uniref:Four and a half LIM domains protein 3 n=1 Tax=Liparis tanakae TaxID=230148 RepID=A0A4Z2JHF0_9TELE|nr:Four and a half LIM domains protein 3 [Liparis tanakae]
MSWEDAEGQQSRLWGRVASSRSVSDFPDREEVSSGFLCGDSQVLGCYCEGRKTSSMDALLKLNGVGSHICEERTRTDIMAEEVPPVTESDRKRGLQSITMADSFDCANCKESLYGRKYIQSDDSPYCIPCYDSRFSNTCDECKELIAHDARELFYEDRHYHEHCFRCFRCDRSLADEPFTSQEEALLCNDCYCNEFSSKCVACDKVVMPGTKKLEYAGSTWHEGCFVCHSCDQPIGSKSFIPDKDEHYCVSCYEDKFSPRCTRCKKTLAKGGVTYREEPWHKECFVCTSCKTQLAGQHFTSREESPYCLKCFGNLYAKKLRRRKVHLVRGTPVAPAMLHLLPVLRLTGGRRLFPRWPREDPVPRLQQQPIERSLRPHRHPSLDLPVTRRHSVSRTPESLPRKATQANKCRPSGCLCIERSVPRGPRVSAMNHRQDFLLNNTS